MGKAQLDNVLQHVRSAVVSSGARELTDDQLLHEFAVHHDPGAFAVLVKRHGPCVLGVCRRVLHHVQDAEDAFQATFLVLARHSTGFRKEGALASWLHGVAYRVAMRSKRSAARRRTHERRVRPSPPLEPAWEEAWREVQVVLDEEIQRLPEKYRTAFILCCMQGMSKREAARQLAAKEGTVSSRLAEARRRLQLRLARRGIALSAVLAAGALARPTAGATVPPALVSSTAQTVRLLAAGEPAAGVASVHITTLTEGVLRAMLLTRIKIATTLVLGLAIFTAGLGGLAYSIRAADEPKVPPGAGTSEPARPGVVLTLTGWGTGLDPAGDCKFTIGKDKLTVVVPGTDHALCIERSQMNAPRVLREIEGDFIAQVKVGGDYPNGGTSVVPTRRAFHGAGLLLWRDENNYIRLERAKLSDNGQDPSYGSFELRRDGKFERGGTTGEAPLNDQETFLRLERNGDKVYGSVSSDGIHWTSLDPIEVEFPRKLMVGIVAGQNTSTGFAPEFSAFKVFQETRR
jgi:RNA polymerase sigma factor (sigma-70 family)